MKHVLQFIGDLDCLKHLKNGRFFFFWTTFALFSVLRTADQQRTTAFPCFWHHSALRGWSSDARKQGYTRCYLTPHLLHPERLRWNSFAAVMMCSRLFTTHTQARPLPWPIMIWLQENSQRNSNPQKIMRHCLLNVNWRIILIGSLLVTSKTCLD